MNTRHFTHKNICFLNRNLQELVFRFLTHYMYSHLCYTSNQALANTYNFFLGVASAT